MYYYLYDTFLSDKKYEKVLDQVKTRLLDLGIQGKHERLSLLKSIDSLIADEIKRGAKTIIVVGNDKTFLKAVDIVAKHKVTLGIIPIGENNALAKTLGVPVAEKSCDVLAARKIAKFDLGQANNHYFFSNIKINNNIERISISHKGYKIIPKTKCTEVGVCNFFFSETDYDKKLNKVNPQDGFLDLVIKSEEKKTGLAKFISKKVEERVDTVIKGVNFEIKSFEYLPLLVDEYKIIKTPISIRVADKTINVIVGKTEREWI